ncbi:transcription initiation factor TFIID subunit 7-like [Tubulanus polymorphus]|uniref:transcription initiation factor TFIID subunit 7-like n=1 Tax=Tubulanus polymorphus TaxID=672921 RepID=UPI003DA59D27
MSGNKGMKFPLFIKKKIPFKSKNQGSKKKGGGVFGGKSRGGKREGGGTVGRPPGKLSSAHHQIGAGPSQVQRKDDAFDLEQQFILRMPIGPALALKHDIQSGSMNLKDKLTIEVPLDKRVGRVRYGGQYLKATLHDLPCITECLKTTDKKTFYKTADICQMLLCKEDADTSDSADEETQSKKDKDKDRKFRYPHGLTPPLKNVRKKRFRKTLQKNYTEQPDIEKEVKRLFRADNEAIDVKWEIIYDDDSAPGERLKGETTNEPSVISHADSSTNLAEHIFGEVSSSEEEDDDKDVNIMDSEDDEEGGGAVRDETVPQTDDLDVSQMSVDNTELEMKLSELGQQLQELKEQRQKQEAEISAIDNLALRQRFQDVLDELIHEEQEKQKEYELLAAMLNQV